jgi:hypothetical protein
MISSIPLCLRLVFCLLSLSLLSFAAPVLNLIEPRGGQRGTEVEVHFHGDRLEAASEALFYEAGLTLTPLELKDPKHGVAKLTIAPDAPLGEHSIRLRGPNGISELRSFWVGQFPTVAEQEPNNTFDQPQRVELNSTVQGVAGNEDEDTYVCTLKKGQRLAVEVEAMRLGRVLFDASIAILGPNRFELATCDDSPLLRTDACAAILAPEDGDYRIVVREAAYEGNDACQYRLHIGTFPRPKAVFPTGGKPGETIEFTFLGDPNGPIKQTITLPAAPSDSYPLFPQHDGLSSPSPHLIVVSPLESVREAAPNGDAKSATPMTAIPSAAHGVLDGDQKQDWFQFNAKKGEVLILRALARQLRSPLDAVLTVTDAAGKALASNDDQGGLDSQLTWTCPADGSFCIQIRDQLDRTGPDFTYRIEITQRAPALAATLPTIERVNTQKWKTFAIPRGNRYAAVVNLARQNTACEAVFEAPSLPPGLTLQSPPISKGMTSFPIVLEATAEAPIGGGLMPFVIKSSGLEPALTGSLTDTIHHIDVNNEGAYHSVTLDRIPTAVCAEVPFKIDLLPSAVPIVKNGTLGLVVRATRAAGFAEKITVRFLWNPPGVSGPVTLEIPGDQTEIRYELNANADAAVGDWQVCVLAEANSPQGPVLVSSSLVPLKVAEPYLTFSIDLAATEQGRATPVLGKMALLKDFAGQATVELMGLPHGAKTTPQSFTKDQAEITFPVEIAADAAVGKHASLFCRVSVPENGTPIIHQTGQGGTLRIDAPAPAPVAKADPAPAATPPATPPPATPTEKPLSRLEQLRNRGNAQSATPPAK